MSDPIALPTLFTTEPAPRTQRSTAADTAASVVLWILFLGTAYVAAMFAGLYAMAADGCPPGPCAASDKAGAAILLQWAGIAAIVVGIGVVTVVRARRRRYTFYWPLAGIGLVVLCTVVTSSMANAAMAL
ncbi:hypothetical protein HWD35_12540 [Tsukamurella tyrosinosolvens]|uniref:hypothetical protein n=1 Tax=Tsukamurella tyrosinosolvens TaxID=57704 RepID=UPI000795035A|nr:hypothetical protein [Tsukamurella tyrosinosolvens]KXP04578.1 hypothetical protein AXK59_14365 [Tsukamurella tyrosinosolvens]KZL97830.1 hypothetical protein AXX05_02560 [Tsukamurella tyrosinosolvens]MCA4995540.1 hypothetical protein [Tsukamurella tyrosinosolvens]WEL92074.1 hypothetical protein P1N98_12875 [Tsukamurella tyrosinosolvens]